MPRLTPSPSLSTMALRPRMIGCLTAIALLLSGCASISQSETQLPLSQSGRVTGVELSADTSLPQGFEAKFEAIVLEQLAKCATGQSALTVRVLLTQVQKRGTVNTLIIAGSNRIHGKVDIVAQDGTVVGRYSIGKRIWSSGMGGLVALSDYQTQLSRAFGQELCQQAFRP